MRRFRAASALLAVGLTTGVPTPAAASTLAFSSEAAIAVPGAFDDGPADPYPADIVVDGVVGVLTGVRVVIPSFGHEHPGDVILLLRGPGGQTVQLLSDAGGVDPVTGVRLAFEDGRAPVPAGGPLVSGTYGPSPAAAGDAGELVAPAPPPPYGRSFAAFDETDPNGTWSLFVFDDGVNDTGTLAQGWRLELDVRQTMCDDAPEDGFADVPQANVHEANIDCIVAFGLAAGTSATTFLPSADVSRAQMATFVSRVVELVGALPVAPPDAFTDDDGSIHEARIDALAAAGVIGGNGEDGDRYLPEAPMRRDHLASFLYEAYTALAGRPLPEGPDWFNDDDGNAHETAIDALAHADVLSGTGGGGYTPDGTVTRAQMGSFLARFLAVLVRDGLVVP